jgi:thiol-disulfide isomerase/thioredoxin
MKNWLLALVTILTVQTTFAQDDAAPYKQNKNLPSFKLETPTSGIFSSEKIKKNHPVIIMFFSPGCDHCIHQFEDMTKRMADLKNFQIIMPTYQPVEELAAFNKKYNLQKYPNIVTGRDADYFFPPFYEIANFPHFAFYDKGGKLISTFEGNISVDNILKKFK